MAFLDGPFYVFSRLPWGSIGFGGLRVAPTLARAASDSIALPNGVPAGFTFTRATTATAFGPAGALYTAAAGELRHEWDALTGEYKGWLLEGSGTNLLTYSEDFTNAAWQIANSCAKTSATRLTSGDVNSACYSNIGVSANTTVYCSSWGVYKTGNSTAVCCAAIYSGGTGQQSGVTINPATGAYTPYGSGTFGVKDCGDHWLVWIALANNGTNTTISPEVLPDMDNLNRHADVSKMQVEVGSYPTSYIPTTSAQVTRAADSLTIATSAFPFNAAEGVLYVEFETHAPYIYGGCALGVDAGTWQNSVGISVAAIGKAVVLSYSSGAQNLATGLGYSALNTASRVALGYKTGSYAASCNGNTPSTSIAAGIPAVTTLSVGAYSGGGGPINGHIRHIAYFPRRLSNAELQLLTK